MSSSTEYDTVVVGAGVAGLHAAYILQETYKQKVLVLEAKDRIGGRLYATDIKCAKGTDRWDLGGQWIGKNQHNVMKALSDFNMEIYDQFTNGTTKFVFHNLSNIKSYSGLFPPFGPLELLEMNSLINKIDKLSETIDPDNICSHPNAVEWDSISLHNFINENCRFPATKEIFESLIRASGGADLSAISLLNLLYDCKICGGNLSALFGSDDGAGAQDLRVKETLFALCEKLAAKLDDILLSEPVTGIDQANGEYVDIMTKSGKEFRCKHVVISIPPHLVNHIEFVPSLPNDRIRLGESMSPSHCIKFIVTYEKAFWRENGLSGSIMCTALPCTIGPVTATLDATTSNENPAIVGFVCAEHAIYWTNKSTEERKEAVLNTLAATLGDEAYNVIEYIDKDWSKETYNGGCPGSIMKPRTMLYYHHALRQQYGRVHWAGTETARVWSGYVDGALESSSRSVLEVVNDEVPPLSAWKTSPAFENFNAFTSKIYKKQSRLKWKAVTATLIVAAAGAMIGGLIYLAVNNGK